MRSTRFAGIVMVILFACQYYGCCEVPDDVTGDYYAMVEADHAIPGSFVLEQVGSNVFVTGDPMKFGYYDIDTGQLIMIDPLGPDWTFSADCCEGIKVLYGHIGEVEVIYSE